MKHWLTEYFYHSKTERRGAFVLLILATLLFLLPQAYPAFVQPDASGYQPYADSVRQYLWAASSAEPEATEEGLLFPFDPNTLSPDSLVLLGLPRRVAQTIVKFREKVRPFRQPEDLLDIYTLDEADYQRLLPYVRIRSAPKQPRTIAASVAQPKSEDQEGVSHLFPFDPNTLSGDSLQLLGFRGRIVRNLLKYREKGGRFYKKEDLKKIYGLRQSTYERVAAHIQIQPPSNPPGTTSQDPGPEPAVIAVSVAKKAPLSIDVNQASPDDWQQLQGIGPSYARRICAFRDKLGGFVSVKQVAETYGLPDSTFQNLRPRLELSPVFRQIQVNEVDAAALQAHPYLSWKQANAIIAYRSQHGAFRSLEEVAKVRALPADLHRKMRGYWSLD